ncbi:hypothetical protein SAMN05421773_11942 [Streptomyces aidingensis]|uniref:Uncharacterized protein n=1 Tax=Streptomyces aidingensis TaxID=910347 RepID=A0A1I1TCH7_9ACTN|nr:hypothetical protein SAMN05421773_11942 [Streptomyces aidingensis]
MVLLLLVLLGVLVFWALRTTAGNGGDQEPSGRDDNAGGGPAESITPGPTGTESVIDTRPGGRDETTGGTADETGDGAESGGADGQDGGDGGADGQDGQDGQDGAEGDAGGTAAGQSGGGEGISVPVGSLPDCRQSQVRISVRSDEPEYPPQSRPELLVTAENTSGTDCRIDLGHRAVTIELAFTGGDDEEQVWTSQECPAGPASVVRAVARGSSVTHSVIWDRRYSAAADEGSGDCRSTKERPPAPAGTYLMDVAVDLGGDATGTAQSVFTLSED